MCERLPNYCFFVLNKLITQPLQIKSAAALHRFGTAPQPRFPKNFISKFYVNIVFIYVQFYCESLQQ